MSRADWSFLEHLLEEGSGGEGRSSTCAGRAWLTVLLLFRVLVLGAAAESAWDDEQCSFVCNTQQPGCEAVCYDRAFPISHFRYFVLQVIFVSTPTVFYLGYAAARAARDKPGEGEGGEEGGEGPVTAAAATESRSSEKAPDESREERRAERDAKRANDGGGDAKAEAAAEAAEATTTPKLKGRLLAAYTVSVSATVLLEAGFIGGLWLLYGSFLVAAVYECAGAPCPHTVDCFVSRPTEKSVFTVYTQVIAGLSLLLNLAELLHLLRLRVKSRRTPPPPPLPRAADDRRPRGTPPAEEAPSYLLVPVGGSPPEPSRGPGGRGGEEPAPGGDVPPSYLNCLGGRGASRSPRAHLKKHAAHGNGKHRKDNHRTHGGKLKHYV